MNGYSKVRHTFWTGDTGRKLRSAGKDAQLLALYLMTAPTSNWIGLYYLPMPTICHEIGLSQEGASKALRRVCEAGFAYYDEASELVFVPEMARFQIEDTLKPDDKRIKGIAKDLELFRKSTFCEMFWSRYAARFHLPNLSPIEAPPKPPSPSPTPSPTTAPAPAPAPSCGAASDDAASPDEFHALPILETIPCKGNGKAGFDVLASHVEEFQRAYPAIDVLAEIRKARAWSIANPKLQKTHDGMMRFLNSWLAKAQNQTGRPGYGKPDIHEINQRTFDRMMTRDAGGKGFFE